MKANKRFYDKLREEVENNSGVATCFVAVAKKTKESEKSQNLGEPVSGGKIVEDIKKDDMIKDMQGKIEALQTQVAALEKRNDELTKENRVLQNNQKEASPDHDNESSKGLIDVKRILEWAYIVKGDNRFIEVLRTMLQDFEWDNILNKDDYCEDVRKYEEELKKKEKTIINVNEGGHYNDIHDNGTVNHK